MTISPALWLMLVIVLLLLVGKFGARFLTKAAPAMVGFPRLAIASLVSGILIWPMTLLSLSLILAWVISGPAMLPGEASQVCQQCLNSSNPFRASTIETWIPSLLLLVFPVLAGTVLAISIVAKYRARRRRSSATAAVIFEGSTRQMIQGYQVSVVSDDRPWALTFSSKQGGVVISTGAVARLSSEELAAVLAHEQAHVVQRHHVVSDLVNSVAESLRWVPCIRDAATILPMYLEIAADNQACQHVSTPALVRALLILGDKTPLAGASSVEDGPLFAAGTDRIPYLVRPVINRMGYFPALAGAALIIALGTVSAYVFFSYAGALLSGCM